MPRHSDLLRGPVDPGRMAKDQPCPGVATQTHQVDL